MSAADEAYVEAQHLIAKAKASGSIILDLDTKATRVLDRLPVEIFDLPYLRILVLKNTQIIDFSPLATLTSLTQLRLDNTQINDLAPLSTMTGLTRLYLNNTQINDLAPLATLAGLTRLRLNNAQITDLGPLAALTRLTELRLNNTQITDLGPLAAHVSLTELILNNTLVTNLAPLATLTGLTALRLHNTPIIHLDPLATLTGLKRLWLSNTKITELAPLSALTGLTRLYLNDTKITDLTPLATLTNLTALSLGRSAVLDLRPLRALQLLAESQDTIGLSFQNTAATRADKRIAEIAAMKDAATRTRELFDYLKDWVPPDEVAVPAKPDPIFETVIIDGKLELLPDLPSQEEQVEPLKRHLHQRLQTSVPDLARAAGNQFPRLAAKARILAGLVEKPFEQLDMISIHLEVEVLQERLNAGTEEGVIFPDEVRGPLSDVTRVGPGLTVGNAMVDLFIERVRQTREHPAPAEEQAVHADLSAKIVADPVANGPNSIAMETLIAALKDGDARQAAQKPKHQWLLWTLSGVGALADCTSVAKDYGPAITAFVVKSAPALIAVAVTYGAPFAIWFGAIMGPIFLALGVEEEIVKRLKK